MGVIVKAGTSFAERERPPAPKASRERTEGGTVIIGSDAESAEVSVCWDQNSTRGTIFFTKEQALELAMYLTNHANRL